MDTQNHEPVQSYGSLLLVLLALLSLTALSITVSRLGGPAVKVVAALAIAAGKATLVLLFFMRIGKAGRAVGITFITTLLVLAALVGLTFFDLAFR